MDDRSSVLLLIAYPSFPFDFSSPQAIKSWHTEGKSWRFFLGTFCWPCFRDKGNYRRHKLGSRPNETFHNMEHRQHWLLDLSEHGITCTSPPQLNNKKHNQARNMWFLTRTETSQTSSIPNQRTWVSSSSFPTPSPLHTSCIEMGSTSWRR